MVIKDNCEGELRRHITNHVSNYAIKIMYYPDRSFMAQNRVTEDIKDIIEEKINDY
jgi:hypothetical protein